MNYGVKEALEDAIIRATEHYIDVAIYIDGQEKTNDKIIEKLDTVVSKILMIKEKVRNEILELQKRRGSLLVTLPIPETNHCVSVFPEQEERLSAIELNYIRMLSRMLDKKFKNSSDLAFRIMSFLEANLTKTDRQLLLLMHCLDGKYRPRQEVCDFFKDNVEEFPGGPKTHSRIYAQLNKIARTVRGKFYRKAPISQEILKSVIPEDGNND